MDEHQDLILLSRKRRTCCENPFHQVTTVRPFTTDNRRSLLQGAPDTNENGSRAPQNVQNLVYEPKTLSFFVLLPGWSDSSEFQCFGDLGVGSILVRVWGPLLRPVSLGFATNPSESPFFFTKSRKIPGSLVCPTRAVQELTP